MQGERQVFLRAPILFLKEHTLTPIAEFPHRGNGTLIAAMWPKAGVLLTSTSWELLHASFQHRFAANIFIFTEMKTEKAIPSRQSYTTYISDLQSCVCILAHRLLGNNVSLIWAIYRYPRELKRKVPLGSSVLGTKSNLATRCCDYFYRNTNKS